MAREVRIERRGAPGLDAAEKLYVTRDSDGERLIPEPTGEALYDTLTAPLTAAATSVQRIGEQVEAIGAATKDERIATANVRDQAQQVVDAGPQLLLARDQSVEARIISVQSAESVRQQAQNIPTTGELPTHVHAFIDQIGRLVGGWLVDGTLDAEPSERLRQLTNYVQMASVPGYLLGAIDTDYRLLGGITDIGELDLPLTPARRDEVNVVKTLADMGIIFGVLDSENRLIWAVYNDGSVTGGAAAPAAGIDPTALLFDSEPVTFGQSVRIVSQIADPASALTFATRAVGRKGANGEAAPTMDLTTSGFTHPCVEYVPGGWNGYPFWMALTPYFGVVGTDSQYENPHVFCSLDGKTWIEPLGISNPLDFPNAAPDTDYWSDTELRLGDDGYMHLLYRGNGASRGGRNVVHRRSRDGVNWSERTTIYDCDTLPVIGTANAILSPSFVKSGSRWICYDVNQSSATAGNLAIPAQKNQTGQFLFRRDAPSIDAGWGDYSLDQIVDLKNRPWPSSHDPWHVHASKIGNLWLLAINVGPTGGSTGQSLWLAWSTEGWSFRVIETPLFSSATYRSCLCPTGFDADGRLDVLVYRARTDDGSISLHRLKLEITA